MVSDRIVRLPLVEPSRAAPLQERQLNLFQPAQDKASYITFLDTDTLDQNRFLNIMARNSVSTVIDLRPAPVFKRPAYDHREIVAYFTARHINYFEYALAAFDVRAGSAMRVARSIHKRRSDGLTLCLYDESSNAAGWMDAARAHLKRSRLYVAEINPRSLLAGR